MIIINPITYDKGAVSEEDYISCKNLVGSAQKRISCMILES